MGYAEGRACLSEEQQSEIWQTNLMGHAGCGASQCGAKTRK
jgi:hypothetical protein